MIQFDMSPSILACCGANLVDGGWVRCMFEILHWEKYKKAPPWTVCGPGRGRMPCGVFRAVIFASMQLGRVWGWRRDGRVWTWVNFECTHGCCNVAPGISCFRGCLCPCQEIFAADSAHTLVTGCAWLVVCVCLCVCVCVCLCVEAPPCVCVCVCVGFGRRGVVGERVRGCE